MADFLALDWEPGRLFAVDAQTQIGGIRVRQAVELVWPEDLDPQTDVVRAGKWLKTALKEAGMSATQVLLSLPREDVVVRQLELPAAPENEMPDMVRLQAATKSTIPLDQLLLDYLPLPLEEDSESNSVLMTTVPTSQITPIKELLGAAGLELMSIGISPVFTAELAVRAQRRMPAAADELSLIITRHNARVEISLMRQGHLLFSHSTQVHGEDTSSNDRAIVAEINRSRLSLQGILGQSEIAHVWVLGSETETTGLCALIRERLECDVQALDPFEAVDTKAKVVAHLEHRSGFSSPVGMLLSHGGGQIPSIDFLDPRRKQIPPDTRKIKIAAAVAAVFLVAVCGFAWQLVHRSNLDALIETAKKKDADLRAVIEKGEPTLYVSTQIDDWNHRNVNLLDTMTLFNQSFAQLNVDDSSDTGIATRSSHRIYLTNFNFDTNSPSSQFMMTIGVNSKTPDGVHQLEDDLYARKYDVSPEIKSKSKNQDPVYPTYASKKLELGSKLNKLKGSTRSKSLTRFKSQPSRR